MYIYKCISWIYILKSSFLVYVLSGWYYVYVHMKLYILSFSFIITVRGRSKIKSKFNKITNANQTMNERCFIKSEPLQKIAAFILVK